MAVKYGLVEITNKPVRFWFEYNDKAIKQIPTIITNETNLKVEK
jgi:hypothetical protein